MAEVQISAIETATETTPSTVATSSVDSGSTRLEREWVQWEGAVNYVPRVKHQVVDWANWNLS